ncbi:MAG: LysR family transcriptional regulator [Acholeplasmatales bacterium]|nr:LysR family transcriptional regulator [Acholeplasmatales bacterium]
MMDSKLITFITLLEEKNYTNTAKKLYITQPAVTHHIKAIEKEYDITLFNNPKTFELTRSGQILLEYAKGSRLQDELLFNTLKKQSTFVLNIGFTPLAVKVSNKRVLENINDEKLIYNFYCYAYNDLTKMLSSGELDFAIIDNSFDSTIYQSQLLFPERIILVASPNGQYKSVNKLTRDQLSVATIILPDQVGGLYNSVKATMKIKNIKIKDIQVLTSNNLDLTLTLINRNDGVAFVYENSVTDLIEKGELKRLELANFAPTQNFYLIYNKFLSFDENISKFIDLLKESGI